MELMPMDDGVRLRTWASGEPSSLAPVIALHGGPGMWGYLEPVASMVDQLTVAHRFAAPYPINDDANRMLNDEWNARDETWLVQDVRARLVGPIMFVHGSGDPRPSSSVAELAAVIPQARLDIIDGAGHDLSRERPDELGRLLTELVTGQSG